jgi:hypothetical protein
MATLKPLDIQYGLSLNGTVVLDRERNLAVENASIKNLNITGTLTAINTTDSYLKDNNILLNSGIAPGAITTLGAITGGSNYSQGFYRNVPLVVSSGQAGVGATADITVGTNGSVSAVTIVNGGFGYATNTVFTVDAADIDSDLIPDGTNFSVPVTAVTAGSAATDAFITVGRGTSGADVSLKWRETQDSFFGSPRWQLTNDGTNYYSIYVTNDASTSATANKLVLRDGSGNINVTDIGAVNGTFSGNVAVNGGNLTTTSTTATLFNTNVTTLSVGGAATTLNVANTGTGARTVNLATTATGGASTLTFGGTVTGNTIEINGVAAGEINLTTDVTTGTANLFTSVTGKVQVGGVGTKLYAGTQTAITGTTTIVATTSQTVTDQFSTSEFRSAEYLIQITQGSSYQVSKIILVHDGTTPYITEYGTILSGASVLSTIDADISGGNARLLVTMANASSASVKVSRTSITV